MACRVTITSVTPYGLPGQPLTSIEVRGTATECASVVVTISCGGPLLTQSVAVTAQGNWQGTFANLADTGCLCGTGFLRASAHCKNDVTCGDSRTLSPIPCEPYPCPTIDHIDAQLPNCAQVVQDNGWSVTLDAAIAGSGVTNYIWSFGDGQTLSGPSLQQVSHLYGCAGSYVVTLVVTSDCQPGYIDIDTRTIELPPCGCPSMSDFGAYAAGGNPCHWKFNVKLGPPFASCVQEYLWTFDDGSQETTTVSEVEHSYAHDGLYTVMVTMLGGVGQVGGGPCFATKQINVSGCGDGGHDDDDHHHHDPCPWWDPRCWHLPSLCGVMLALALAAIALAGALFIGGYCAAIGYLIAAAIVAAILGLVLLGAWYLACSKLDAHFCQTLKKLIVIFKYIVATQPILLGILYLLGILTGACLIGALITWGYYGTVLGYLLLIHDWAGCPP